MAKNGSEQLTLDVGIYPDPVSYIKEHTPLERGATEKKPRKYPRPAVPKASQPYLPGLSRRGRPRSPNPVPATVRATESRKRRIEAGVKRIELLVAPEIAADLDLLTEHFRTSRVELLGRLIARAAKRVRDAEKKIADQSR